MEKEAYTMSQKLILFISLVVIAVLTTNCTQRIIDFTVISSKNCNIPGARGERVTGSDTVPLILSIPLGRPNLKDAVDKAIEKGGGDCLIDGVVRSSFYDFLIFGWMGYEIEGTIVNTREVSENQ